eukprot:s236_g31.t1
MHLAQEEAHKVEVSQLKQTHLEQMTEMQKKHQEELSQMEEKHQKQMRIVMLGCEAALDDVSGAKTAADDQVEEMKTELAATKKEPSTQYKISLYWKGQWQDGEVDLPFSLYSFKKVADAGEDAVDLDEEKAGNLLLILLCQPWKKALNEDAKIFPVVEEEAYKYVLELRQLGAPRTKPSRFLESLSFAFHMLGADVGTSLQSPRLKGAVVSPLVVPKKKTPLELWQVMAFEHLAIHGSGQEAIFAGYVCMILHARLRWSDGQHCQYEPYLDIHNGTGYLETELYHHKTAGRQKQSRRLLPAACCIPGLFGDWATPWLRNRAADGLQAKPGVPTMPAPLAGGNWSLVPLEPAQATVWMREILSHLRPGVPVKDLGTHSLKATVLSWLAKCCCSESLRRVAGYHIDPSSKSALEYSRDGQAPVLHAIEGVYIIISQGLFRPDESRSRRWSNPACKSLQEAMTFLAGPRSGVQGDDKDDYEPESPLADIWETVGSDGEVSLSSVSDGESQLFEHGCDTSDEDREAEVSAPIVGASLAQELHYSLQGVLVFRHLKSGCCHIAKESDVAEEDGESMVLREEQHRRPGRWIDLSGPETLQISFACLTVFAQGENFSVTDDL